MDFSVWVLFALANVFLGLYAFFFSFLFNLFAYFVLLYSCLYKKMEGN